MFRGFQFLIAASLVLASQTSLAVAQEIRIGMSLPLSGPSEKLARQYEFGARLALETHNSQSGSNAALYISDDGCNEEIAALAADELRAREPQIITGLLCNVAAYHFADSFREDEIPILVAGAQSERLIKDREKSGWNLYRISPGDNEAAEAAVAHFSQAWINKPYAIVDDGTVYGRNLADTFRSGMEELNLPPQFQDNFRPTQSTQARLVRRLRRAGTSNVFIGASAEDVAMIARNSEELSIPLEIGSGEALSILPFLEAHTLPAGTVTAILKSAEVSPELPETLVTRLNQADLQPEPYILLGYQAMEVALEAARPTPEASQKALDTLTFNTILGTVRFAANGDNSEPQYRAYRWKDGRFKGTKDEKASQ